MEILFIFGILFQFQQIVSLPVVKNAFAGNSGDGESFTDAANDALLKKTSAVGDVQVAALETFSNPTNIDNANPETEGIPSKILSVYDNVQKKVANTLSVEPILDNIREEDKYGNTGDQLYYLNQGIVSGVEAISNVVNKIIEAPQEIFRKLSRSLSAKLNQIGGYAVGLR